MSRYIDADNLHNAKFQDVSGYGENVAYRVGWNDAIDAICENEPSVEIEPKRGEWIPCTKSGLALTELMRREGQKWYGYRCSNCNHIYKGNALTDCNFCPNCGAKMKGADDE